MTKNFNGNLIELKFRYSTYFYTLTIEVREFTTQGENLQGHSIEWDMLHPSSYDIHTTTWNKEKGEYELSITFVSSIRESSVINEFSQAENERYKQEWREMGVIIF